MDDVFPRQSELIRLFVNPQIPANKEFHEVTPGQLEEYITEYKDKKPKNDHKRNQYHQLAVMAKVDNKTTGIELQRLLQNDVRTLLVQANRNKPQDLEQIFTKINACVEKFYKENVYRTPVGIAVEVNGELLITGRLRNDQSIFLEEGHIIVLTNNEEYRNCCFKEVVYVSNLWRYSEVMMLGDVIRIGNEGQIVTEVVKCGSMRPLTVKVTKPGLLTSFMSLKTDYYVEAKELSGKDTVDVDSAIRYGAHILVIPGIRSVAFLKAIKEHIGEEIQLMGSIDFRYLESKFIDIADHLMELSGVLIDNLFCSTSQKLIAGAIAQCKTLEKALVGSVPLKTCSDFKKLENHVRIRQMDCLLIQKSPLRMKFPLIARKLLPVGNQGLEVPPLESLSCKDGIINFVLRTIHSIPCQGIVVTNSCPKAALALSHSHIYCPVIVVVESDQVARLLNLRKNLKTVVCREKTEATDLGVEYARKQGILLTGDFIISISDSMNEDSQICVNLRAYFLPPTEEELFK